jgi:tetratricopeptide (TPR) repeat protein
MKRVILSLIILILSLPAVFGNINHIKFNKIEEHKKLEADFLYIKDNQAYYAGWIPKWRYDINKNDLISKLEETYKVIDSIPTMNTELLLLKADIAHYLYNLDITEYSDSAINYYQAAIKKSPEDYRGYWFLAHHYAQSDIPSKAVDLFLKVEQMKPVVKPADFWEDYAKATAVANMPSHALYGMDKTKAILGHAGNVENELGESIFKQIVNLNPDNNYLKEDIWRITCGEKMTYVCRPLGVKITVDTTWTISPYDYSKHICGFVINPPAIKDKDGKEIGYTIAVLMKVVNDSDKLDDYLNKSISEFGTNKTKIQFSNKYNRMIAYEIKEPKLYKNFGGGHFYAIGIERNMPDYPGLLLENPFLLPGFEAGKVNYFSVTGSYNRFKGKIFYNIILDSCEDIHDQSLLIFKNLFENQLLIE